jgi:hypothetical protein
MIVSYTLAIVAGYCVCTASPPAQVLNARHTGNAMPSETNRTLPSAYATLIPPE